MSKCIFCSDTIVISNNVVVALGHVAVALKDSPRTTETILHQCLLQRFCRPPSSLDTLIVDQIGCMLLAKNEVRILVTFYTFLKHFLHILK